MLSGTLRYGSHIEGIEFEKIEIPSTEPGLGMVEVDSDKDGNISIVVHVAQIAFPSEATALGFREATRVVNVLAVELGRPVSDPVPKYHALKDEAANVHFLEDWARFSAWAGCVNKLGGRSVATLASALSEPTPPGEADYQLFRACLNTTDAASRFMSFYRLLGRLADPTGKDRQSEIDALIRKHEPGAGETISPQTGKPETIYSKLRNEHMHRSHVPLARVRSEMEMQLSGLIAIVRTAIKNA